MLELEDSYYVICLQVTQETNVWDMLTFGCQLKDEYNTVRLHKETPVIVDKTVYLQLDHFALLGNCLFRHLK